MASDGEEDYLSDKYLLQETAASAKPPTYAERRKQAQRQAELKNAQNRKKSRRQLEEEAREEGLRRSLFERAQAEERELGLQNKAMSMMLKMGFKPGETLGRGSSGPSASAPAAGPSSGPPNLAPSPSPSPSHPEPDPSVPPTKGPDLHHRAVPLPVDVWTGKKGVGLGKRAASPGAAERLAKAARVGEDEAKETYRSRTRADYEERRATGRLLGATRTLISLDEKAGVQFNALSLDPQDTTTFPAELLELLSGGNGDGDSDGGPGARTLLGDRETESERLRQQMQLDALHPLDDPALDGESGVGPEQPKPASLPLSLSEETVEDAKAFLQLGPQDRLERVIRYLREKYYYCFWCGTQYNDKEDLDSNCPGVDEDAHD